MPQGNLTRKKAKALMSGAAPRRAQRVGSGASGANLGRSREAGSGFAIPRQNISRTRSRTKKPGSRRMTTELPGRGITPPRRRPASPKPSAPKTRKPPARRAAPQSPGLVPNRSGPFRGGTALPTPSRRRGRPSAPSNVGPSRGGMTLPRVGITPPRQRRGLAKKILRQTRRQARRVARRSR